MHLHLLVLKLRKHSAGIGHTCRRIRRRRRTLLVPKWVLRRGLWRAWPC
jgi:hypothetical protein